MKIKLVVLLFIFFSVSCLNSQTPPYYHYTTSDGLTSSVVFSMIQNSENYIWFASLNGLSRFDGSNFLNYSVKDGLNSNNVTCIAERVDKEIYIGTYDKGINILKNNKIFKHGDSGANSTPISNLIFSDNKLILYSYDNLNVISQDSNSIPFSYTMNKSFPDSLHLNKLLKLNDSTLLAATSKGFYLYQDNKFTKLNIQGLENLEVFWIVQDAGGIIYAGSKGKIILLKDFDAIKTININILKENRVFRILSDSKGNIWFSIINGGFYFIPAGTEIIVDVGSKMNLQKTQINYLDEDNEGNIWICTFGDGVYCLNNLYIRNYAQNAGLSNNNIYAVDQDRFGRILIGTFNGLNILDNDKIHTLKSGISKITDYIYKIKVYGDTVCVSGAFNTNHEIIEKSINKTIFNFFDAASFCWTRYNVFYFGGWGNLIYSNPYYPDSISYLGERTAIIGEEPNHNRINDIFEDSKGNLWIASALGVCRITNKVKSEFRNDNILNSTVKSITEDKENKVWFAGDNGIASFDLQTDLINDYSSISDYDLSFSTSILSDNANNLWIGNMNGLYRFDGKEITYLNSTSGISSNEVLSLFYDSLRNNLWIGTSGGLSCLNIDNFEKYIFNEPVLKINKITAGDSTFIYSNGLELDQDQHYIKIDISAINFSSPKSLIYQFNLNGEWESAKSSILEFHALSKGKYELYIKAKSINSRWSNPVYLSFTVKPRYYETIWFSVLIFSLFGLFILFISYLRIRYNKNKSKEQIELQKRINELKHQALSAMMNPHFIFNSLNSVQHLVNTDKKDEANEYITLMARLIRMNLNYANQTFIKLDEEITKLELYLKIERLRFGGKISYEIEVGNDIVLENLKIPNMIIQPFVENSIWHGCTPAGRPGYVKVSIKFENVLIDNIKNKFLMIYVIDNGIGFEESAKSKKEGHISKGIQIIQDRLNLLSKDLKMPNPIIINDTKKKYSASQGTEIIISLPPSLYIITDSI